MEQAEGSILGTNLGTCGTRIHDRELRSTVE